MGKRGKYKNTTKEERANALNRIICPKCGYQNHMFYVKKFGTCNLCKATIDKEYFIRKMFDTLRRINNER